MFEIQNVKDNFDVLVQTWTTLSQKPYKGMVLNIKI